MDKKIEELEKRIKDLESKLNQSSNMFGRSYSQVGSSNSDFLIKTRGQVKVQWGTKFIDLIKDGKINVDSSFIFTVDSVDKLGVKDGIYLTKDGSVYLKVGRNPAINLVGEVGSTYVSFQEEQETTSDQKYMAMQNIGFIYPSIEDVSSTSLQNGIIYIESEQKLYTIRNGSLSEFSIKLPNPMTEQFVIAKSDSSRGALLIKGSGINNSLAFDQLLIYSEFGGSYINSEGALYFRVGSTDIFVVDEQSITFNNPAIAPMFKSDGATESSGFRLYINDSESTLEVDNLIVRNQDPSTHCQNSYQTQWYTKTNTISKLDKFTNPADPSEQGFQVVLVYENEFWVGDCLYAYATIKGNKSNTQIKIPFTVVAIDTEYGNTLYVKIDETILTSPGFSDMTEADMFEGLVGATVFLAGSEYNPEPILRRDRFNIDILESSSFEDEQNTDSIKVRMGDLSDLGLSELIEEEDVGITGLGIYSEQAYFKKVAYTSPDDLSEDDDSSNIASTEWVRKVVKDWLPIGTIIAFHGEEIPEGWAICDGKNGTPNLIGKFITGGESEEEGEQIEINPMAMTSIMSPLTVKITPTYYSLVFIMKIS